MPADLAVDRTVSRPWTWLYAHQLVGCPTLRTGKIFETFGHDTALYLRTGGQQASRRYRRLAILPLAALYTTPLALAARPRRPAGGAKAGRVDALLPG